MVENLYNNSDEFPAKWQGGVVAIGNFDGVHKGHQALLQQARVIADQLKTHVVALTFTPHPRAFFQPLTEPFLLTSTEDRYSKLLEQADCVLSLPFTKELASLTAEEFISDILKDALNAAHVITGSDFHFGYQRGGSINTIAHAGVPATAFDLVKTGEGLPYSSTVIREELKNGRIAEANELLGWFWHIKGQVSHGDKRGRELGYPTANIDMGDYCSPAYGIYAVKIKVDGEWHIGAANIGIRPMFEVKKPLLEVYILDFDREIYGEDVIVEPVAYLRGEMKFDNLDDLKQQMAKDVADTRLIFASE